MGGTPARGPRPTPWQRRVRGEGCEQPGPGADRNVDAVPPRGLPGRGRPARPGGGWGRTDEGVWPVGAAETRKTAGPRRRVGPSANSRTRPRTPLPTSSPRRASARDPGDALGNKAVPAPPVPRDLPASRGTVTGDSRVPRSAGAAHPRAQGPFPRGRGAALRTPPPAQGPRRPAPRPAPSPRPLSPAAAPLHPQTHAGSSTSLFTSFYFFIFCRALDCLCLDVGLPSGEP